VVSDGGPVICVLVIFIFEKPLREEFVKWAWDEENVAVEAIHSCTSFIKKRNSTMRLL
jgi:hypothetical protein